MKKCLAFLIMALAPSLTYANTGIFEGSGHTIKLVRSEDVQLRSEMVRITPGRGWCLFNGSIGDRVDYDCKFVLKNRSKKPVTIQVGFPLTSQFLARSDDMKADDATALVLKYRFIVRDKERTYHVRFVPYDQTKTLGAIFLWDMTFQADEVRELNVAYEMPTAIGLGDTTKDSDDIVRRTQELLLPPAGGRAAGSEGGRRDVPKSASDSRHDVKDWYPILTSNIFEGLEYVTVTGQSWAGPIESAKFELNVKGFEQYLNERYVIERPPYTAEQLAEIEKEKKETVARIENAIKSGELKGSPSELRDLLNDAAQEPRFDWHIKDRLIYRQVLPAGWKEADGVITWEFKNYHPKDAIQVAYLLTVFPRRPEAVPSFVNLVLGSKPSKEDLADLREVYLAWWGISPKRESARLFVSSQRWYAPKNGMTADKLTPEQKAVVSALERCSAANHGK